ncbi:hypothetical protein H5410_035443 [Solanum commersonii]|uniref:Uncharacterized protein n=1 Tax=Solanum commersonii TaxID=4109 RepID=A0A9J5Y0P3_SOLCO|nr:hypothetical protein H5410_035443 [Solanum commersonii]
MLFLLMNLDNVDLLEMYLISENIVKHFVVSSRSPGRTSLITPSKSYDDVDLLEMYLISGNVVKCFTVSSRSPGRTPLITPSKSYVVDVVAFSDCRMLVKEFSSSNCRMLIEEFFFIPLECHVHPLFIVVGGGQGCL